MKKQLNKAVLALVLSLSLTNCSTESIDLESNNNASSQSTVECNTKAKVRFTNNGTKAFTFKIYDENLNLIVEKINVAPSTSTNWFSFLEGDIIFSLKSDEANSSTISRQVYVHKCNEYNVTVKPDNTLDSDLSI
ncbi:hypothetical protein [uncultured Lacinutrix sp.]|uniref:hypothetical protein n=1 Tax=uncultured Lacinutrix sp. TaxID=574032 RepID=UPI00260CFA59|nr:hypothetical protein [uncultured Lacinutrix sp.]